MSCAKIQLQIISASKIKLSGTIPENQILLWVAEGQDSRAFTCFKAAKHMLRCRWWNAWRH